MAGAVAAAKAAASAVMSAQNDVAAAKHAALEQQSAASVKGVEAAKAAHQRFQLKLFSFRMLLVKI